ncbi:MAG: hypothetical protein HC901_01605 [Bdellovibrionaceae bacterium]|nr:hypothetical protein [Pseudobdellovibrionaceae bacterium]
MSSSFPSPYVAVHCSLGALLSASLPVAWGEVADQGSTAGGTSPTGNSLNFQTDPFTGQFSYSIPLAVAPARQGAEPTLGLSYSNRGSNGWCGVGWSLDVGYIQRETKNGIPYLFPGGTQAPASYDDSKGFVVSFGGVNGALVPLGNGQYRSEIESAFLKFQYNGTSWTITDRSGNRFFFGLTSQARLENTSWNGTGSRTVRWALEKIEDVNGNTSGLSYSKDNNFLYLSQIAYNGHLNGLSQTHTVDFTLENRTDSIEDYRFGFASTVNKRLQNVAMKVSGDLVRRYDLAYTPSNSTSRSLLRSVTTIGNDGSTALPPTTFTYSADSVTAQAKQWQESLEWKEGMPFNWIYSNNSKCQDRGFRFGDVNGDGLTDVVQSARDDGSFLENGWQNVYLNTGSGWQRDPAWSKKVPVPLTHIEDDDEYWKPSGGDFIDLNGDGLSDFILAINSLGGLNDLPPRNKSGSTPAPAGSAIPHGRPPSPSISPSRMKVIAKMPAFAGPKSMAMDSLI